MFLYQLEVSYLQNQVRRKGARPLAVLFVFINLPFSSFVHLYVSFAPALNPNQHFKWSKTFIREQRGCLPGNHPPSDVHSGSRKHFQRGGELCFNLQLPVGRRVSVPCLSLLPLDPSVY